MVRRVNFNDKTVVVIETWPLHRVIEQANRKKENLGFKISPSFSLSSNLVGICR